jgi:hypothetical protein
MRMRGRHDARCSLENDEVERGDSAVPRRRCHPTLPQSSMPRYVASMAI